MPAAERQILQDRVDAIAKLVVELQKDAAVPGTSYIFEVATGDAIALLETAATSLLRGIMSLDDAERYVRPERPARDTTVYK